MRLLLPSFVILDDSDGAVSCGLSMLFIAADPLRVGEAAGCLWQNRVRCRSIRRQDVIVETKPLFIEATGETVGESGRSGRLRGTIEWRTEARNRGRRRNIVLAGAAAGMIDSRPIPACDRARISLAALVSACCRPIRSAFGRRSRVVF